MHNKWNGIWRRKKKINRKESEDAFRCSNAIRFCVFDEAGSAQALQHHQTGSASHSRCFLNSSSWAHSNFVLIFRRVPILLTKSRKCITKFKWNYEFVFRLHTICPAFFSSASARDLVYIKFNWVGTYISLAFVTRCVAGQNSRYHHTANGMNSEKRKTTSDNSNRIVFNRISAGRSPSPQNVWIW